MMQGEIKCDFKGFGVFVIFDIPIFSCSLCNELVTKLRFFTFFAYLYAKLYIWCRGTQS